MTANLVTVKQFLIEKLKSDVAVQATLPVARKSDIREAEWQGTDYGYPCIRVYVESFERHTMGADCKLFDVLAHVFVLAEDASSKLCDTIAVAIWDALDTKSTGNSNVRLVGIKATHLGAVWSEEQGLWKSEIRITCQAS